MSAFGTVVDGYWTFSSRVGTALLTPGMVLHECTHYVASIPWADTLSIDIRLGPRSAVRARWRDAASGRGIVFAQIAPTLMGILLVPLFAVAVNVVDIGSISELLGIVVVAANWLVFTWPSQDDREFMR